MRAPLPETAEMGEDVEFGSVLDVRDDGRLYRMAGACPMLPVGIALTSLRRGMTVRIGARDTDPDVLTAGTFGFGRR